MLQDLLGMLAQLKKNQSTLDHMYTFSTTPTGDKLNDADVKAILIPAAKIIQDMVNKMEMCKTHKRVEGKRSK